MRRYFLIFGVAPVLTLTLWALATYKAEAPTTNSSAPNENANIVTAKNFTEIKTSSLVTTLPINNASLTTSPNVVSLGFSKPLGPASTITVKDDRNDALHLGAGTFSDDRQTMTVLLRSDIKGPVLVTYSACSVDNVCETGTFGFNVL